MNDEKLKEVLTAMQGITYLEWQKLKHTIDVCFNADVSTATNKMQLADVDRIVESYSHTFG